MESKTNNPYIIPSLVTGMTALGANAVRVKDDRFLSKNFSSTLDELADADKFVNVDRELRKLPKGLGKRIIHVTPNEKDVARKVAKIGIKPGSGDFRRLMKLVNGLKADADLGMGGIFPVADRKYYVLVSNNKMHKAILGHEIGHVLSSGKMGGVRDKLISMSRTMGYLDERRAWKRAPKGYVTKADKVLKKNMLGSHRYSLMKHYNKYLTPAAILLGLAAAVKHVKGKNDAK